MDASSAGLAGFREVNLHCAGREDPRAHANAVEEAVRGLLDPAPDLLVVQGDTSSALGAARAGFACGVPVGHVEAGLRTHDLARPWPEEGNRIEIDARAELLFAPTSIAAQNLAAEPAGGAIHITGNTAIDAVLDAARQLPVPRPRDSGIARLLVTCHRRESWGAALSSIAAALSDLAEHPNITIDVVLHPNAFVAERMGHLLGGIQRICLLPPCTHLELLQRMQEADLVLSDSGGIQEEAPALGVPLLVLREKTERPEGIASGCARLVGTSREAIVDETLCLLRNPIERARMSKPSFPYGDGRAGARIGSIIVEWLRQRGCGVQPAALRAGGW